MTTLPQETREPRTGLEPGLDPDVAAYRNNPQHPARTSSPCNLTVSTEQAVPQSELLLAAVALGFWLMFFCMGIFVPTLPHRQALLGGSQSVAGWFGSLLLVVACYALTNILFLSMTAAFLGGVTRRWYVTPQSPAEPKSGAICPRRAYLSAILRGFFLYLMMVAGFLTVTTEKSLMDTTLEQYVRMAGVTSVVAFIMGFDPQILNRLMNRVMNLADVVGGSRPEPQRPEDRPR